MIDFICFVINVLLAMWDYDQGKMGPSFGVSCAVAAWCFRGWIDSLVRQEEKE
jgi:hypothetical protein